MSPFLVAGDAAELAERIKLPAAETTTVVPRPKDVSHLWVEDEYEELTQEQVALWEATAAAEAREFKVKHAGLDLHATELAHTVAGNRELLDQARNHYRQAQAVLAPFRRRAVGTKHWYKAAKGVIFVGDLAGFSSAAIWLGETWFTALTLAASAAAATVVAGLVGTDYSDMRRRKLRERTTEQLEPEKVPFAHLFSSADSGSLIVKRVLLLSLVAAVMVGAGIGALRAAVDDLLVGAVFAGIALAVAGGSFLVAYAGADEVADLIDLYRFDYETLRKSHFQLAADSSWKDWSEHGAKDASLRAEFTSRGTAATRQMQALKWRILRNNPSVAGHGPHTDNAVGRAPRKVGK